MSYEETFEHKGFTIVLSPEDWPESPAQHDDMMERFLVGFHRQFTVHYADKSDGRYDDDAPVIRTPEDVLAYMPKEAIVQHFLGEGYEPDEAQEEAEATHEPGWIVLPLQAYIHGGVHLSLGSFGCPWDSGQVGWVFVKEENEWGKNKDGTAITHEQIAEWLVNEWNSYLSGDIWFVNVLDSDGEVLESVGHIVGMENALEIAKNEIVDPRVDGTKEVPVKILHTDGTWAQATGTVPMYVGDSKAPEWLMQHSCGEDGWRNVEEIIISAAKAAKESVA